MNKTSRLEQIAQYLSIWYPFTTNISLLNGKMGGVIFLYHYSKYSNKSQYRHIAENLIEDIYKQINIDMPINFSYGLCGIGWAFEYLIQNKFIEADSDDILEDIDAKVMEYNVSKIKDLDFNTGISGIAYYIITRIESHKRTGHTLPFDSVYLENLLEVLNENTEICKNKINTDLSRTLTDIVNGELEYNKTLEIPTFLYKSNNVNLNELRSNPIGIENGLTGAALKLIFQ